MSAPPVEKDAPFFDDEFLAELEGLTSATPAAGAAPFENDLNLRLRAALATEDGEILDESAFAALPKDALVARSDALLEACRASAQRGGLPAVENFIVFFQAMVPILHGAGSQEIQRVFYRLAPVLLHIAWHDFSGRPEEQAEGREALKALESILIEISGVRLAPTESELVLRNIAQLASFIEVGEYAMANEIISARLLAVIRKNKVTRALYRIMEVEVAVQVYLKEKLDYSTPQLRIPDDFEALADYGPIRIIREWAAGGMRAFLILQIPDIPTLRDVVVTLVRDDDGISHELRLDAVGSVELKLPPATYRIGLVYQPA